MSNMLARLRTATVRRKETEKVPTTIFEHEKPLLERLYDDGSVTFISEADGGAAPKIVLLDSKVEMDRLRMKYGADHEVAESLVDYVFRRDVRELERLAYDGDEEHDEDWTGDERVVTSKGKRKAEGKLASKKTSKKKSTKSSGKKVDENSNGYQSIDEITAKLYELGIEYDDNGSRDSLHADLSISVMEMLDHYSIAYDASSSLEAMVALLPENATYQDLEGEGI